MPGQVDGTDTISFISKDDVPGDRKKDVTYGRIVVGHRPGNVEPNQTRFTIDGDRINHPDDCGTLTADLLTVKLITNSLISTEKAKFMTLDIIFFN